MSVIQLNRTTRWKLKIKRFFRSLFPQKKVVAPTVSDSYYDPKQFRRRR